MATQKKTAEVDYSMQEKIMALYELQKIDSKIDEINFGSFLLCCHIMSSIV